MQFSYEFYGWTYSAEYTERILLKVLFDIYQMVLRKSEWFVENRYFYLRGCIEKYYFVISDVKNFFLEMIIMSKLW